MNKIAELFATVFYSGYLPKAPGTFGTFAALIICLPFLFFPSISGFAILTLVSIVIGFVATHIFLNGKTEDMQHVVIDEMAGLYISILLPMIAAKACNSSIKMIYVFLACFVLFRIFDITKPLLVGYFDRNFHGATGIMMDDIAAGIFAGSIISILILTYHFVQA